MAQQTDSINVSLYPPPPPFVRFFTDDNIEKLEKLKSEGDAKDTELQLKDEEEELGFLIPPQQPKTEYYRSFGNIWQVSC